MARTSKYPKNYKLQCKHFGQYESSAGLYVNAFTRFARVRTMDFGVDVKFRRTIDLRKSIERNSR